MRAHTPRITVDTAAASLVLQHVNYFVQELDEVELIFSVAAMRTMGRSTIAFLKQAATISSEYELAHLHTDGVQQPALRLAIGDDDMEKNDEGKDERKEGAAMIYAKEDKKIQATFDEKVTEASTASFSAAGSYRLRSLLDKY